MADRNIETNIILKGMAHPSLKQAFKNAEKLTDNNVDALKNFGAVAAKVAKAAGAAMVAGLAVSAKAAIEYESAFAGVMKTVNETANTSYDDISNAIRQMSTEMPSSATQIAEVAEIAGQLGICADDIVDFSKVMIQLGETTNLASDEAASSIAKYANIVNMSMSDVDKFGSTIVALGNNSATTEADIMNMASRIAGSGSQIGLTNQEILALSASLSSVGIEAEAGGTAISTVMSEIDKAVGLNSAELTTWAETAGMSTAQFKKVWETDAMGAMQAILKGMGDVKNGGGNLNVLLEDLGVTGIRTSDTMKRLTNASGLLGDSLDLANSAWDENVALTNEANTRYGTMESKIAMFKNQLTNAAITIGNAMMPAMDAILAKMREIDWEGVGEKIGNAIQWVIDHSTTLIAVLGAVGGAFAAVKVLGIVKGLMTVIKVITTVSKAFGFFKVILALAGGPVTLIVAAIGALIGIFAALWIKCEGFRNFWKGLWNGIKNIASLVGNWLKNFFTVTIPDAWNACIEWLKSGVDKAKTFFSGLGPAIKSGFDTAMNFFKELPGKVWTWLLNTIAKITAWRAQMIAKAKEVGLNFITAVANFFKDLPYKLGYALGVAIGKVIQWGINLKTFATTKVPEFINAVLNWFKQLPGRIWTWLVNTYNRVTAWGSNMVSAGKAKASQFINSVITYVKALPGRVWTWLTSTYQKVTAWGSNVVSTGKAKASQFINSVISFVRQLPGKVWTWLVNAAQKVVAWGSSLAAKGRAAATMLKNAVVNGVKSIPGKLKEIGVNLVKSLWNGIASVKDWIMSKIKGFGSGIIDGVKSVFSIASPSKVMMKLGKFLPEGFGKGIVANTKTAITGIKTMGKKVLTASSRINPEIRTRISNGVGKIRAYASGGTVTRPHMAIVGDAPETIVPHGDKPRNRALLAEAARNVGVGGGGNVINVTFAPVVNGGNAEENRRMLQEEEAEFERRMDEYFAKKGRLAFS